MSNNKKYWKGVEELTNSETFQESKNREFSEYLPAEDFLADDKVLENSNTSRRDFLKYLGFGVTAASLAACEAPVNKVIPHVIKTDKANPGVANYFSSMYSDGFDYCDVIVKTREGRPIRIDANKKSPFSIGGISARVNSSVMSLYDGKRLKKPSIDGAEVSWNTFNSKVKADLDAIIAKGGKIRFLTHSIISPSTLKLIQEYIDANPSADIKHVEYDTVSASGTLEANKEDFGKALLPLYNLSKAKSIVSIGADFISNFPAATQLAHQYVKARNPENKWMSKHFQFESTMSLTGTNADVRVPVKLSDQSKVVVGLYNYLASKTGGNALGSISTAYDKKIKMAGDHLLSNKGESIVLCGVNDKGTQLIVNAINKLLGNYGNTIDINKAVYLRKGLESELADLLKEMNAGAVDALIVNGSNPVYSVSSDMGFEKAMGKVKTTIVFADRPTATSDKAKYVGAAPYYLEAWDDAKPMDGFYALAQPTINPLFDTQQFQDALLSWSASDLSYYDYIRKNWEENIFSKQSESTFFEDFWVNSLHDGFIAIDDKYSAVEQIENGVALSAYAAKIKSSKGADWEIEFYANTGIGDGKQAHNPILQELPDPVTKFTWDNYLLMNPKDAKENGFAIEYGEQKNADTVNLTINGIVFEKVPVIAQPGQVKGTLAVALGYGQTLGKNDEIVGINFFPAYKNGQSFSTSVSFEATGEDYPVATTQTHQTVMGRDSVVRETTLDVYKKGDIDDFNPPHLIATHDGPKNVKDIDLWAKHPVAEVGHHWGMSIDLNACTGCGACVTACNIENNVPVVGKDEVRRSREMHWMRIDRYFSSNPTDVEERNYTAMETPEDNPQVVHQPMMCQHCNHAPCETVCPVAATTHSNEGLNQMTYNRCIGTRYCANNCPYKVRRFNWFSYQNYSKFSAFNPAQDDLGRMVLNPDVTVRARGVMEKCSMCIQMIQETKLKAKKAGRPIKDEDLVSACSAACSSDAIVFGDLNDKSSKVLERSRNDRSYRVIEEVGADSNVYYQVKVRNT